MQLQSGSSVRSTLNAIEELPEGTLCAIEELPAGTLHVK